MNILRLIRGSFAKISAPFTFFALTLAVAANSGCQGDISGEVPNGAPEREWTFLVFLNGHNSLDEFGAVNINQMEEVGSSDSVNVVVQWASAWNEGTQRLRIEKDDDTNVVTSPVIEELPRVDMGNWNRLVDFVRWGVEHYPAKHYFIDVWNHGSGWRGVSPRAAGALTAGKRFPAPAPGIPGMPEGVFYDISFDDFSGHQITTAQLGEAMKESAKIIGHKVDIYGSDACLMAMAEVAREMSDSVDVFVGSEELEPGMGWPYQTFLGRWVDKPQATAAEVGTMLSQEFLASYSDGVNGTDSVTFSALDLSKIGGLSSAVARLGDEIKTLNASDRSAILDAAWDTQSFYSGDGDYLDVGDFVAQAAKKKVIDADVLAGVSDAIADLVITTNNSPHYAKASGISMWIPGWQGLFNSYSTKYRKLKFDQDNHWSDSLEYLLQDAY